MNRRLILVVILALSSCKRSAPESTESVPIKASIAGVNMIEYYPENEGFRCLAPADWKMKEDAASSDDGVVMMHDRSSIIIVKNSAKNYGSAEKYANTFWEVDPKGQQPAVEKKVLDGKVVYQLNRLQPKYKLHSKQLLFTAREDHAFIDTAGGFYQIIHSAPTDSYQATLPVFEAVVRSFKPKN